MTIRPLPLLTFVALAGCGGPSADRSTRALAAPSASTASTSSAPSGGRVAVRAIESVPARVAIDGDLGEWSGLDSTGSPTASSAAFAMTSTRGYLVGRIEDDHAKGIWIGVSLADGFELPAAGNVFHGPFTFDCTLAQRGGSEATPEQARECEAARAKHEAWLERFKARFVRYYHVTEAGISMAAADGSPLPLEADFRATKDEGGVRFEASLPLEALPRTNQAPLSVVRLVAGRDRPTPADDGWTRGALHRVVFEPRAELREHAFKTKRGVQPGMFIAYLSYELRTPDLLEGVRYGGPHGDATALETVERPLFVPEGTHGGREIGRFFNTDTFFVELDPKTSLPTAELAIGERVWTSIRGDDLFVLTFDDGPNPDMTIGGAPLRAANFGGMLILADGTSVERVRPYPQELYWTTVTPEVSPDLETFSMKGPAYPRMMMGPMPAVDAKVTWTFDARTLLYEYETSP